MDVMHCFFTFCQMGPPSHSVHAASNLHYTLRLPGQAEHQCVFSCSKKGTSGGFLRTEVSLTNRSTCARALEMDPSPAERNTEPNYNDAIPKNIPAPPKCPLKYSTHCQTEAMRSCTEDKERASQLALLDTGQSLYPEAPHSP